MFWGLFGILCFYFSHSKLVAHFCCRTRSLAIPSETVLAQRKLLDEIKGKEEKMTLAGEKVNKVTVDCDAKSIQIETLKK